MNTSTLKFADKAKSSVTYKNHKFQYDSSQSNQTSVTFLCIHHDCGANIVLDNQKSKIISSNLEHMNHTPVSHRLRSNKNIILNSEVQPKITTKAKKRVSFSVSSASNTKTIKPSSSSKSTKPSANVKKIKKPDTLETVEHQTRDATPNNCDSLLVPTSFISNHVVDTEIGKLSTLDTRSKANTYDSTCNMPSTSDNMQHNDTTKLRVTFGTQTDDDNLSWLHTKEILTNKINEQEAEIENLKLQVECLETLLYKPNDQLSQPKSNSKSTPSSISPKFTCHIVGDSHVRGLRDRLSPLLPKGCTSHAFFKPGAGYHEVAQSTKNMFNPSSRDPVVLLCGTNDVCSTQWEIVQRALDGILQKLHHCQLLCLIEVPLRYSNKKMNYHIIRFNTKVKNYVKSKSNNVHFLNPNKFLKPRDYAVDGLHLNKGGKSKLCSKIFSVISHIEPLSKEQSNEPSRLSRASHANPMIVDLIDLTDLEPLQTCAQNIQNTDESTFSSSNSRNYHPMFPDVTPHKVNHFSNIVHSLLDTPNIPDHINQLLSNEPHSSDYYRIAHISHSSFSNNAAHSSPIPTITPGYNRPQNGNFKDQGQMSTT